MECKIVIMSDFKVSVRSFYGDTNYRPNIFDAKCGDNSAVYELPSNLSRILGPSNVWKVFRKQSELLDYLSFKARNLSLMPFVFQNSNDERLFLAAHPLVFWYYDDHRKANQRHSYEIIRENHPCKLYFDLEFHRPTNPTHDGDRMIQTFTKIIIFMLKVPCCYTDVLDLDSSTDVKFSHHLIFQLPQHAFQNNYHAGYFVEKVCCEILANIHGINTEIDLKIECNISLAELSELMVTDEKENSTLFCDRSVYSKNRHFRLYKSSKLGKNAALLVSRNNKYCVKNASESSQEEQTFLASLITYFPNEFLLNCEVMNFNIENSSSLQLRNCPSDSNRVSAKASSAYPKVDKFVQDLIAPGRIWRVLSFDDNKSLVYDIVGNRFCQNIGRAHKSNNIMIVVDTAKCVYYQKCYDHDCKGFRSNEVKLPYEICFYLYPDNDLLRSTEEDLQLLEDGAFSFDDCLRISQEPMQPSKVRENCEEYNGASSIASGSESKVSCANDTGTDSQFFEEEIGAEVCQILDILEDESFEIEGDFDLK